VAEHRGQIQAILSSWCRLVVDERGVSLPDSDEVVVTAPWLAKHVDWLAASQGFADDVVHEIRRLTGRAHKLRDPDRRMPIGERCRVVPEGAERCSGTVAMVIGSDELWSARCDVCGPQEAEPYMHDRVSGRWVTVERVQAYALHNHGVRVAGATVRDWVRRGRIESKDEQGKTWYELGSVQRYLIGRERRAAAEIAEHAAATAVAS
jgi:hypothetical protein